MATLRERQKEQRRSAILNAADELFHKQGFSKTNMDNIAEHAGVGVATVYNYFGTKLELLRVLLEPEISRVREEAQTVLSNIPDTAIEGIIQLMRCFYIKPGWQDKNLLQPFSEDFLLYRFNKWNAFFEMEEIGVESFTQLLRHYKNTGKIAADMNIDDAVFLLMGNVLLHLRMFLAGGNQFDSTLYDILLRRVRFIFDDKSIKNVK